MNIDFIKINLSNKYINENVYNKILKKDKDHVSITSDIVRTYPIFYYWDNNSWNITNTLPINEFKNWKIRNDLLEEFLLTGYVTSNETLLNNVFQVEGGTTVELYPNKEKKITPYFKYSTYDIINEPFEELQRILKNIYKGVFEDLLNDLNGRNAVIPLSGGYDSRLVATMLKHLGYENVVCYTYGKKDSFEVKTSQKVAQNLGFKWHFVEYNEEIFKRILEDGIFFKYLDYGFNFVSVPHIQDFFAVYELKCNGLIPDNSIFIPGHSGDLFAGTHIFNVNRSSNKNKISEEIFNHHYILTNTEKRKKFIDRIKNQLTDGLPWTVMEEWDIKNRQAKFIVNSVRVYEFFGYEHRTPLWDERLAKFFSTVDIKFKNRNNNYNFENNLYDAVAFYYFKKYNVDYLKRISNKNKVNRLLRSIYRNVLKTLPYKYEYKIRDFISSIKYDDVCSYNELLKEIGINEYPHKVNYGVARLCCELLKN